VNLSHVLIIDDEPSISRRLRSWLRKRDYPCTFVDTEEEASSLLRRGRYDVVVYGHEFQFQSDFSRGLPNPR
jgi:DNA-binding response OmpR family regulator